MSKVIIPDSAEAEARKNQLDNFLKQLLLISEAISNRHIVSFLGALRAVESPSEAGKSRQMIHVSNIEDHASWGDVILFRCSNPVSGLQRLATGSEWDHVGVVVQLFQSGRLLLLESTVEGVTAIPLKIRLEAYAHFKVAQYMVIRKYCGRRDPDHLKTLKKFVNESIGVPYGFNISKLLSGLRRTRVLESVQQVPSESEIGAQLKPEEVEDRNISTVSSPPHHSGTTTPSSSAATKQKSFFCSELVAAALIASGQIPETYNPTSFWPGSFSMGKELDSICPEYGNPY